MRYILWFWRTKDSCPPSLFAFITLITYQFSLLPFACLACLCASLCSRTLVSPLTLPGVLTYQHTWFCLFAIFTLVYCQVAPIISYRFYQRVFSISRVLSLTFHFSLYSSPFLTSFSSLLHLPVCFLSPCVASVLCGRTGESDWRGECAVLPTTIPDSTVPERREHASVSTIPGYIRRKRLGVCSSSASLPPPYPHVVIIDKPHGPFVRWIVCLKARFGHWSRP